MQGSDVLTVIAEIGVALAGFSGIVVALRQRSAESWSLPEVMRLRFMLYGSTLTFLFALSPFVFHHHSPFVFSRHIGSDDLRCSLAKGKPTSQQLSLVAC